MKNTEFSFNSVLRQTIKITEKLQTIENVETKLQLTDYYAMQLKSLLFILDTGYDNNFVDSKNFNIDFNEFSIRFFGRYCIYSQKYKAVLDSYMKDFLTIATYFYLKS